MITAGRGIPRYRYTATILHDTARYYTIPIRYQYDTARTRYFRSCRCGSSRSAHVDAERTVDAAHVVAELSSPSHHNRCMAHAGAHLPHPLRDAENSATAPHAGHKPTHSNHKLRARVKLKDHAPLADQMASTSGTMHGARGSRSPAPSARR